MAATDMETPYAGGGYSTRTAETQGSELCSSAGSRGEGEREGGDTETAPAVDMFAAEFVTLSEGADEAGERWSFSEPLRGTWNPCSYCRRGAAAARSVLSPFPEPASSSFSVSPSSSSPSAFCGRWASSPFLRCFRSRSVPRVPPFVEGVRLKNGDFVEVFCLPCINVGVSQSSASFTIPPPADLRCYIGPPALQYRGLPHFIGYHKPVVIHRVYLSLAAEEELKQHQRQLLQLRQQQQQWPGQRLQHQDQGLWQEEVQVAERDQLEQEQQQEVEEETQTLQNQGQQQRDEEGQQEQFLKQSYAVDSPGGEQVERRYSYSLCTLVE